MTGKTVAAILFLGLGRAGFGADERREPPLKYTLEIDGRKHELVLDKALRIPGDYHNPRIVLRASPVRNFTYGGITFRYPATFSWDAEIEGPHMKMWTLSGKDCKIMYFIQPGAVSVESYALAMAKQFGKGSTRISDTERTLGDRKYKGKLLLVKLAGVALRLEVYALPAKTGCRWLVFQDSPPEKRKFSTEGEKTLRMFSRSFTDKLMLKKRRTGDDE